MKWILPFLALTFATAAVAAENGKPAPDFALKSSTGKSVRLSDYLGKTVVLEWFNYGCPFVLKHYNSGNMQKLQKTYTDKGVIWLSVLSSAKGKQGYANTEQAEADRKKHGSNATAVLLDPTGKVGKDLYDAKTTPHMFVVNSKGNLVYQGAIDSIAGTELEEIAKAKNFVQLALDHLLDPKRAKEPLADAQTDPYGCNVKYADKTK